MKGMLWRLRAPYRHAVKAGRDRYHLISGPQSPWGDYGDILVHGMSAHLSRRGGKLQLERTGPFIPPMTFPGLHDIVVTDDMRKRLEEPGFTGMKFRPVIKTRIVRLDWHRWDKTAAAPKSFPRGGEPEGYILDRRHSPDLARRLGRVWELVPARVRDLRREGGRVVLKKSPKVDICANPPLHGYVVVSERLRDWLTSNAGEWVLFESAR